MSAIRHYENLWPIVVSTTSVERDRGCIKSASVDIIDRISNRILPTRWRGYKYILSRTRHNDCFVCQKTGQSVPIVLPKLSVKIRKSAISITPSSLRSPIFKALIRIESTPATNTVSLIVVLEPEIYALSE